MRRESNESQSLQRHVIDFMVRISIVLPTLNEAANIAAAVKLAWACRPHEVLVVDGGSKDDTAALAQAAGAIVLQSPRGRGSQQNLGAQQATGDVLLFLHADNWLAADACRQIETALESSHIVCGAFEQSIQAAGRRYRLLERGNAWRVRWRGMPYGDQGIFIRRDTFQQLGGFADVPLMEDWLLMRKLRRVSRPVLLPGPIMVSARRWQRHGVVRQTLRNWSLVLATSVGVSPHALARYYAPHVELPAAPKPEQRHAG